MGTKFSDFMKQVEAEAKAEGPHALEELAAFREHFRIGRQLAEARLKLGLTQKQVAAKARINQSEVSDIERGRANPTFNTLSAVAMAVRYQVALVPPPRRKR